MKKHAQFNEEAVFGDQERTHGSHLEAIRFDPLDAKVSNDPDWAHIDAVCFGIKQSDMQNEAAALLMAVIKVFAANPKGRSFEEMAPLIAIRVISLGWVVDPSIFGGVSLAKISAKYAVDYRVLKWHARRWSRLLSIRNRAQFTAKGLGRNQGRVDVSRN